MYRLRLKLKFGYIRYDYVLCVLLSFAGVAVVWCVTPLSSVSWMLRLLQCWDVTVCLKQRSFYSRPVSPEAETSVTVSYDCRYTGMGDSSWQTDATVLLQCSQTAAFLPHQRTDGL